MDIGSRIRQLREEKGMSQVDIEEMAGLHRTYVSRVENSHILPSLETLQRFAAVLDVPMYRLFYTPGSPLSSAPTLWKTLEELARGEGAEGANARFLLELKQYSSKIRDRDREALLALAHRLAAPAAAPAGCSRETNLS